VSVWDIATPLPAVWEAISQPEDWPRWWPYVAAVELLRAGDADGLGAVRRFEWHTRLPYRIRLEVETVTVERQRLLVARATGDAKGVGTWRLASDGAGTRLQYEWRIRLDRRWMRWLAPLAAPLYKWNHNGVMRAGAAGLARYLREAAGTR
jgi:uncharacterized protein YndB with AHSA1/START domain